MIPRSQRLIDQCRHLLIKQVEDVELDVRRIAQLKLNGDRGVERIGIGGGENR